MDQGILWNVFYKKPQKTAGIVFALSLVTKMSLMKLNEKKPAESEKKPQELENELGTGRYDKKQENKNPGSKADNKNIKDKQDEGSQYFDPETLIMI